MILYKKSQTSVEILIFVSVLMVVFILFLSMVGDRNKVAFVYSKQFAADELGYDLASSVNEVNVGGHGSNKISILPDNIGGFGNYGVVINSGNRILEIIIGEKKYEYQLVTSNIKGSYIVGANNLVSNNRGVITITQF